MKSPDTPRAYRFRYPEAEPPPSLGRLFRALKPFGPSEGYGLCFGLGKEESGGAWFTSPGLRKGMVTCGKRTTIRTRETEMLVTFRR